MKNKGLKIAVLAALFVGSIALLRRSKNKSKKQERLNLFVLMTPSETDQSAKVEYWKEGDKYFMQPTKNGVALDITEVTREDFDKNYQAYLN